MKKAKLKKQSKNETKKDIQENFSTKTKIITASLMLLSLVGFYFLTTKVAKKVEKDNDKVEQITLPNVRESNSIKYSKIDDIKDDSYYLLLEKENDSSKNSYDSFINLFKMQNYSKEFYYIDLSDEDNKSILGDKEELKDLKKLKVKDTTLLYIKDGKISEKYVSGEKVVNKLSEIAEKEYNIIITNSNSNDSSNSNKTSNKSNNNKSNSNKSSSNKTSNKSNSNKTSNKSNSNKISNKESNKTSNKKK